MKRSPKSADLASAARADTPENLIAFQRTLKNALIRPLAPGDQTQKQWVDGRPMAEFAETFIKSNNRLTALERLQIYNRMYWFRLFDCFHDDNPGLRATLGSRRFVQLAEAYLAQHPSRSYTLRNLCSRLEAFIRAEPKWTSPDTLLAIDIARFEWAQTVAFDEPGRRELTAAEISGTPPSRLRMGLQPYVTLLALNYPVDDYVIAVKKRDALRSQASNASTASTRETKESKVPRPKRSPVFVAVHRLNQRLYYKRMDALAFKVLTALRDGKPLSRAIASAGPAVTAEAVREWFTTWMHLGWFCPRP